MTICLNPNMYTGHKHQHIIFKQIMKLILLKQHLVRSPLVNEFLHLTESKKTIISSNWTV